MAKYDAKWLNLGVFSANLSLECQKQAKFTTKKAIFDMQFSYLYLDVSLQSRSFYENSESWLLESTSFCFETLLNAKEIWVSKFFATQFFNHLLFMFWSAPLDAMSNSTVSVMFSNNKHGCKQSCDYYFIQNCSWNLSKTWSCQEKTEPVWNQWFRNSWRHSSPWESWTN